MGVPQQECAPQAPPRTSTSRSRGRDEARNGTRDRGPMPARLTHQVHDRDTPARLSWRGGRPGLDPAGSALSAKDTGPWPPPGGPEAGDLATRAAGVRARRDGRTRRTPDAVGWRGRCCPCAACRRSARRRRGRSGRRRRRPHGQPGRRSAGSAMRVSPDRTRGLALSGALHTRGRNPAARIRARPPTAPSYSGSEAKNSRRGVTASMGAGWSGMAYVRRNSLRVPAARSRGTRPPVASTA